MEREYASLDRLMSRRLDRTGWLRFDELDEEQTLLAAVAEVRPRRVLDVGCGDGRLASLIVAPEVVCSDTSPAAVEAALARGLDAQLADAEAFGEELREAFDAEVGRLPLQARFASVSRLYRGGSVMRLTQRDLQTYLDAFVELYGQLLAPDGPYPFTATRRKCVFVADAA